MPDDEEEEGDRYHFNNPVIPLKTRTTTTSNRGTSHGKLAIRNQLKARYDLKELVEVKRFPGLDVLEIDRIEIPSIHRRHISPQYYANTA